jgi:thiol-disulfide isomerase/thioredoxin
VKVTHLSYWPRREKVKKSSFTRSASLRIIGVLNNWGTWTPSLCKEVLMRLHAQRTEWIGRAALGLLVLVGLSGWVGCQPSSTSNPSEHGAEAVAAPAPEAGTKQPGAEQVAMADANADDTLVPVTRKPAAAKASKPTMTADEILEAMAKAYKTARTYADRGEVHVTGQVDGQELNGSAYYLTALERPNKVRIQAYRGTAVCDGKTLWAFVDDRPGQLLQTKAQPELGFDWLFRDQELAKAMADGFTQPFSWAPVQTVLLLANDPLQTFLHDAEKSEVIGSEEIDSRDCYKIETKRTDGKMVFWIDKESYVLRQFEFPTEGLNQSIAGGQIKNFSVVAKFVDAQINGKVDSHAFEFQALEDARTVEQIQPSEIALLGQPAPEFKFTDLEGKEITPASLKGKVAVIDVWATWCEPCRMSLPLVEKVYQQYKDNDKVAFVAVSVDDAKTDDKDVAKAFEDLKVHLPIARDPEQHTGKLLSVASIPTMLLIDAKGTVQAFKMGVEARLDIELPNRLEKLLAGKNLYEGEQAKFQREQEKFETWLNEQIASDCYWNPLPIEVGYAQAEIGERTEPKSLKLKSLWSVKDLKSPGNIVVIPQAGKEPQVLVIDEGKTVVELLPDGKLGEKHTLQLPPGGLAGFLRTTTDKDGKRWFLCGANGLQQIHLFDEKFEHKVDYPADATSNPHAGIADAQIGDLDGDGTPELCIGYWGVVGVQGVSLEGKRIWANKSLATVLRVAILDPDDKGQRNVLCTNQRGTLVLLNPEGEAKGEITLPDYLLHWIVAADLTGDQKSELCALAPTPEGDLTALGIGAKGEMLWAYPLPRGVHERPIEPVSVGDLLPGQTRQWILVAADGSLHFLAADGKPIDQFSYGNTVTGVAGLKWDGRHVLLVATPEGLDAWEVEAP